MTQFDIVLIRQYAKLLPEKKFQIINWLFLLEFLFYGKVNSKIMLTGVFTFYQSFFYGKSFMQF